MLTCAIATLTASASMSDQRPNIVMILCDDLGYSDVGFNGATDIRTPVLDRLAANGTVCSSGYVCHPFCGPSRVGIMTGRYPHVLGAPFNLPASNKGIEAYNRMGIDEGEPLISTVLKDAGYYTGAVGKWHLGIDPQFHPNNRGFDDYYGFLGGGHKYFPEEYRPLYEQAVKNGVKHIWDYLHPLEHNGEEVRETEYITDALSREAARFVRQASEKDQPFFLYVAYNAPHSPLEAKEEDLAEFSEIVDQDRRTYAAMVYAIDRGVGKIVESLREAGELENTLLVFLSDNGGKLSLGATNRPLKGGKGDTYEGGFRVPMFFHWQAGLKGGREFPHPVSSLDFYPTFAALAGAELAPTKTLDGRDIWDDFVAGRDAHADEVVFAMRHRDGFTDVAARQGRWKACRAYNGPWRLHDIEQDLGEERDLSRRHPERLRDLVRSAEAWGRTHPQPKWFHDRAARDSWAAEEMPRFDETFSLD